MAGAILRPSVPRVQHHDSYRSLAGGAVRCGRDIDEQAEGFGEGEDAQGRLILELQ